MGHMLVSESISNAQPPLGRYLINEHCVEMINLALRSVLVVCSSQICDDFEAAIETTVAVAIEFVFGVFGDDACIGCCYQQYSRRCL
jgi:hypothetical protein